MKTSSGFTIVELMTAILIGGILMAVAIPNYTEMVQNNCLTSKTNAIVSTLQLARSTAITRHTDIRVAGLCKLDADGDNVDDGVCANTDEFGDGMVVFQDISGDGRADFVAEDANGNGVLDVGEDLNGNGILDIEEVIRNVSFTCPATVDETSNTVSFIYTPNGAILPTGTFNICDERACADGKGRQVTISATGRPSTNSHFTLP